MPELHQKYAPILRFTFTDPESELRPCSINPNTATADELATVPFLDRPLAEQVVDNRLKYGNYRNLADFHHRLALTSQLTAQLMHYLRF